MNHRTSLCSYISSQYYYSSWLISLEGVTFDPLISIPLSYIVVVPHRNHPFHDVNLPFQVDCAAFISCRALDFSLALLCIPCYKIKWPLYISHSYDERIQFSQIFQPPQWKNCLSSFSFLKQFLISVLPHHIVFLCFLLLLLHIEQFHNHQTPPLIFLNIFNMLSNSCPRR